MCLDNRASGAVHYINKQYEAQWQNASDCVVKHHQVLKPTQYLIETGTCLAEFYYGKHQPRNPHKDDLAFFASFAAPTVRFICNHELILHINLKDGHFNHNYRSPLVVREHHHHFGEGSVAFRVTFKKFAVKDIVESCIGGGAYNLNLLALATESAEFVPELSHLPGLLTEFDLGFDERSRRIEALLFYLHHYLVLFKKAGHHVLHGLPDFDDHPGHIDIIDYSLVGISNILTQTTITAIHGIEITKINEFLKTLWYGHTAILDHWHDARTEVWEAYDKFCLAEHKTLWRENGPEYVDFHVRFGPPQVRPLCKEELIFTFDIQDIRFYLDGFDIDENVHHFHNWKVSLIVDILGAELIDGKITNINLNFKSKLFLLLVCVRYLTYLFPAARYSELLSIFDDTYHDHELLHRFITAVTRYISTHYLVILINAGFNVIHHHDHEIIIVEHGHITKPATAVIWEETTEEVALYCECENSSVCIHQHPRFGFIPWRELFDYRFTGTRTFGWDIITGITQGSINEFYKRWWQFAATVVGRLPKGRNTWDDLETIHHCCAREWTGFVSTGELSENVITATFQAPRVQLSNRPGANTVIFYLVVEEGTVRLVERGKPRVDDKGHDIERWVLAFEVELELRESVFSDSPFHYHDHHLHHAKQLALNFNRVVYREDLSYFQDDGDTIHYLLTRQKRYSFVYWIQNYYFKVLQEAGLDILYTLPFTHPENDGWHPQTPSFLTWQTYPFNYRDSCTHEGVWGVDAAIGNRNMILFLGMLGGRTPPFGLLPWSANWVLDIGKEYSQGTVVLSREIFLEGKLLSFLEEINKLTTIVASFPGVEDNVWYLDLIPWKNHMHKRNRACKWKAIGASTDIANGLEYQWFNSDQWTYRHEQFGGHFKAYSVTCDTKNTLVIPTYYRRGRINLSLSGKVNLKISLDGCAEKVFSTATLQWNATISVVAEHGRALRIQVSQNIVPEFSDFTSTGLHLIGTEHEGDIFEDAITRLKKAFPQIIELDAVIHNLKDIFEGAWPLLYRGHQTLALCNPVFNHAGDLIFELQQSVEESAPYRGIYSIVGDVSKSLIYDTSLRDDTRESALSRSLE
ncbi:hypothetical protein SISSUDRAFT_469671 [Sistotremastrum suecicum HHB10207 ss-3]|uniref:Uncharacterized protein n=1 Tax=Sistotremastrum suecicum HHB10207 ss-3 TaxID=1314776 RepID=A0A165Y5H0_9AGAM|nr:hypothetical protein SISSUDRAFT_469671 [Sistotremastrum suecicum HHB10207 ss-3]